MTPLPSYQERPGHDQLWSTAGPAAEPIMEDPQEHVFDRKQPLGDDTADSTTAAVAGDASPSAGNLPPADIVTDTQTTAATTESAIEDPVSAEPEPPPTQDPTSK